MSNAFNRTTRWLALLGATVLAGTGCLELDVTNLNEPDRDRALAQPEDLEALNGGSFDIFFNTVLNNEGVAVMLPSIGTQMTTVGHGTTEATQEPRLPFRNQEVGGGPLGAVLPVWTEMHTISSNSHDFLETIEAQGITFTENGQDVTPRAIAFAKLMQGLAWGYTAMIFDRAVIIPETEPYSSDALEQTREALVSGAEGPDSPAIQMALAAIDEAISIASSNTFTFPGHNQSRLWFGTPDAVDQDRFIRFANSMAARILVLSARNPEQRAQVPWDRVQSYLDNAITSDFEVVLEPGIRISEWYARINNDGPACNSPGINPLCQRLEYRLLGPADVSGAYQAWISAPVGDRDRFDIVTPDRRITGTDPQAPGAYVRYTENDNGFPSATGTYRRSGYLLAKHEHRGTLPNSGTAKIFTVDEVNLLRAEALLRQDNPAGAANLINISRTRPHTLPDGVTYPGLPGVTADGVPQSPTCVPKTDAGACGDLGVALRYERTVELAGTDATRGYLESRGFGMLVDNTLWHFPVPATELEVLGMPNYTYGGGGEASAVYDPVTSEDF